MTLRSLPAEALDELERLLVELRDAARPTRGSLPIEVAMEAYRRVERATDALTAWTRRHLPAKEPTDA